MRLSRRQYAAHRGVSHTAVGKAIASGRITLELDGTIDPARADRQWDNRTDPAKLPKQRAKNRQPAAGAMGSVTNEAPVAAPKSDPEPNPEPNPVTGDGGISFQQARLAHEVVKTRTANVRLARLKGTLVERDRATALVFRLAREERDAWVTWPARVKEQLVRPVFSGVGGALFRAVLTPEEPWKRRVVQAIAGALSAMFPGGALAHVIDAMTGAGVLSCLAAGFLMGPTANWPSRSYRAGRWGRSDATHAAKAT